jgi:plasmid maintenance system antidote protein VapI
MSTASAPTTPETNERYVAANLLLVLREQGRLQKWVAKQIGVTESMISHVLKGRKTLSRSQAERVSQVLGVPFFVLFNLCEGSTIASEEQDRAD